MDGFGMDLISQYFLLASDYIKIVIIPIVIVLLFLTTCFFFVQFVWPSLRLNMQLRAAIRKLGEVKKRLAGTPIIDLQEMQEVMVTDELQHLWSEFSETLHPQKKQDTSGQLKVTCYRATAMAEVFFSEQALVETPLKTACLLYTSFS